MTVLELDHVLCMVTEPHRAVRCLQDDGWALDAGQVHRGQGTRNRRLVWQQHFFELLWVTDVAEARANALRLDRRAEWSATGASPFGLAFRGRIDAARRDEFWLYDALGLNIWVHADNERSPDRPLVIVLEIAPDEMQHRRQHVGITDAAAHRRAGELREVRLHGPSPPSLPPYTGPPIVHAPGPHRLELVLEVDGTSRPVSDGLAIRS